MLKVIVIFVLFCVLKQNCAFVLRPNADLTENNAIVEENSANGNHLYGKGRARRGEQSIFPESAFVVNPDGSFQVNVPRVDGQIVTSGFQTEFQTVNGVPFSSGSLVPASGPSLYRQIGDPPNPDQQVYRTETFELTPGYQKLYENGEVVEQLPNQSQTSSQQGPGMNQNGSGPQNNLPQQPGQSQMGPVTNGGPQLTLQSQPSVQDPPQYQQPTQTPQYQQPQAQTSTNLNLPQPPQPPQSSQSPQSPQPSLSPTSSQPPQPQPNPIYPNQQMQTPPPGNPPTVQANGAGASSGAYNYNYDPTRPNPVPGNYAAVNGFTPNAPLPNQGTYNMAQGQFPVQQGGQNSNLPRLGIPNLDTLRQSINYINSVTGQQIVDPNILNSLPVNPLSLMGPFQQLTQVFPRLLRNVASQGVEVVKILPDMADAAALAYINDVEKIRFGDFLRLPGEIGRMGIQFFQQILNELGKVADPNMQSTQQMQQMQQMQQWQNMPQMQNMQQWQNTPQMQNTQQMQMQPRPNMPQMQQQVQPGLARRSPKLWMPNFDLSQYSIPFDEAQNKISNMSNFDLSQYSIPFDEAQNKISNMRNEILNKIQIPSIPQNPFSFISKSLAIPQPPTIPQPSADGEPIVKVFSSSVSESTQSSSVNGGPPEVSHQGTSYKYDYDSTNTEDPLQADLVALKSYTPNANDPTLGEYAAFENTYPRKNSN